MNHVFAQASQGFIDYGMLGALQIDPYGNINSSYIGGTYEQPGRRFAGAGGANGIASLCWRTIFVMMQEKRRFVPKLDFVTSPGYLDGSPLPVKGPDCRRTPALIAWSRLWRCSI